MNFGDFVLKWVAPAVVTVVGVLWALYRWELSGASDWMVNLDMVIEELPYSASKDSRLVVVHVKSKNPTGNEIVFKRSNSTFTLSVQRVPPDLKSGVEVVLPDDSNNVLPPVDMLQDIGEAWVFMPGAEFEDVHAFVLESKAVVHLTATLRRNNSTRKDDFDFVSVDRYVSLKEQGGHVP